MPPFDALNRLAHKFGPLFEFFLALSDELLVAVGCLALYLAIRYASKWLAFIVITLMVLAFGAYIHERARPDVVLSPAYIDLAVDQMDVHGRGRVRPHDRLTSSISAGTIIVAETAVRLFERPDGYSTSTTIPRNTCMRVLGRTPPGGRGQKRKVRPWAQVVVTPCPAN